MSYSKKEKFKHNKQLLKQIKRLNLKVVFVSLGNNDV